MHVIFLCTSYLEVAGDCWSVRGPSPIGQCVCQRNWQGPEWKPEAHASAQRFTWFIFTGHGSSKRSTCYSCYSCYNTYWESEWAAQVQRMNRHIDTHRRTIITCIFQHHFDASWTTCIISSWGIPTVGTWNSCCLFVFPALTTLIRTPWTEAKNSKSALTVINKQLCWYMLIKPKEQERNQLLIFVRVDVCWCQIHCSHCSLHENSFDARWGPVTPHSLEVDDAAFGLTQSNATEVVAKRTEETLKISKSVEAGAAIVRLPTVLASILFCSVGTSPLASPCASSNLRFEFGLISEWTQHICNENRLLDATAPVLQVRIWSLFRFSSTRLAPIGPVIQILWNMEQHNCKNFTGVIL